MKNLDDATDDELLDAAKVFARLQLYAQGRLESRKLRRQGMVDIALVLDQKLDVVYEKLPEWARW